ncbi:MAG: Nramp family divalent metal transporter [Winogradskyella sp.]|uniref:Nramp family divalent metal transporter n=1 Tax=Winogradskyella sp. TaxID=1883156 RepID=UPI0017978427|nr:Nramp family divalent metal transporter [Winogradskyella sp.]MBT8244660.1 Nramp family divalent metal transporter [Winogradskyella sp.]NNK22454.1 Nramp family divalent metal transporter [Winogradskyella sp.]
MLNHLKKLGPGLIFAGAAIGVSHLVQSTRAGADFGFGLVWALLLVNLFKYPFFQFGPRYALATGESLVEGYNKLGKWVLVSYFLLSFATMFTIQTAVTIVMASLASFIIFDFQPIFIGSVAFSSIQIWTVILLVICIGILILGRYELLDRLMKFIIVILTICTIIAVFSSASKEGVQLNFEQVFPDSSKWAFLIAFMGWMPAPLDISIWHSLWALEKKKSNPNFKTKSALFDFNIGYVTTIILGLGFIALGAFVLYNSGEKLETTAASFASQLINIYTTSLGDWAYVIIAIAALTTMFSTTLTTFDASPRVMSRTTRLVTNYKYINTYSLWLTVLFVGTLIIFFFLSSELGTLVKTATILSFLTAPFYAIANYKLITSKHVNTKWHPKKGLKILSWLGIIFLIGFSAWYLTIL